MRTSRRAEVLTYLDGLADSIVSRLERLDAAVEKRPHRRHIVEASVKKQRVSLEAELEIIEDALDMIEDAS